VGTEICYLFTKGPNQRRGEQKNEKKKMSFLHTVDREEKKKGKLRSYRLPDGKGELLARTFEKESRMCWGKRKREKRAIIDAKLGRGLAWSSIGAQEKGEGEPALPWPAGQWKRNGVRRFGKKKKKKGER